MSKLLYRIGRYSAMHRGRMILVWILAVIVVAIGAQTLGGAPADSFNVPGTESQKAFDLLDQKFPAQSGSTARVVFHTSEGALTDTANADAIANTLAVIAAGDHVTDVADPLAPDSGLVSPDGATAYAVVVYDVKAEDAGLDAPSINSSRRALKPSKQAFRWSTAATWSNPISAASRPHPSSSASVLP